MADDKGTAVQPPTEPLQVADIPPAPEPSISLKTPSSASRRVRARLARRMTAQRSALSPVLEPLVSVHRQIYPKADLSLLQRAYEVAEQRHASQLRHSGDPYITHPLAVANILAELGMDTTTLVAALLHDTVEDTGTTFAEIERLFGTGVAAIVREVTDDNSLPKAERKRLQVEHAAHISRPAKLVKLADKICNLRDLGDSPPPDWTRQRLREYFDWAKAVVDRMRGVHPQLEALFDREYLRKPLPEPHK